MTDAPFTETHRETLERWFRTLPPSRNRTVGMLEEAIAAALAEIDRLREELARLESIRKAEYGS